MSSLLILASVFASVFCLGLQSQFVNNGHYVLAALNSFLIGLAALTLYRSMPSTTAWLDVAAYLLGGPVAIVCSMVFYRRFNKHIRTFTQ